MWQHEMGKAVFRTCRRSPETPQVLPDTISGQNQAGKPFRLKLQQYLTQIVRRKFIRLTIRTWAIRCGKSIQ